MTRAKFGTHWQLEEFSELQSDLFDLVRYRMSKAESDEVTTLSAQQAADHANSSQKVSSQHSDSAPPLNARNSLKVQNTIKDCEWDPFKVYTEKGSEVDATTALQAEDADSPQTSSKIHSPLLSKAAVADECHSTMVSRDCSQNDKDLNQEAMLQIPAASVLNKWISIEWTDVSSSTSLCDLPTDESVFYEWWESEPAPSPEQMTLAWLGLTRGPEYDEISTFSSQVSSNSGDSFNTPSFDWDDQIWAPSSPEWLNTPSSPGSYVEINWDDQISAPSSPERRNTPTSPGSYVEIDWDDQISAPSSPEWLGTASPRSVLDIDWDDQISAPSSPQWINTPSSLEFEHE